MQSLKPIIAIILDTRYPNKDELYPVKLRATFRVIKKGKSVSVQDYFHLKVHANEVDFKAAKDKPKTKHQSAIRQKIVAAEGRANEILDKRTIVNPELFKRLYNAVGKLESVRPVFEQKIKELEKEGRIGSVTIYSAVKNSLPAELTFYEITPEWIRTYAHGRSATTAAIYLRHIRAIYNKAIALGSINADLYPFGRNGYTIKKTKARKIALSEVDKNRLLKLTDKAVDMWMMSYFCYGLNMTDILSLKVKDLKDDVLMISRGKTGNDLVIPVRTEVKEIILRHGNKTLNPNEYVFPVLTHGLTPRQRKNRIKDFTKEVNAGLKLVQEKLKLDVKLTTYTARHTFAMMALRKGASKEFIQDALGHSSITTTENYLSGFDIKAKKAISAKL